eukprot:TRINITY_DN1354_c0_g1_i2.p1 TRINITY_DN1354_c0_g1~~TRINITY_DN1354_c0_g1_i2.p1  ORF type:complete len:1002 (+),score=207.58 TRINITY_DN1354_c0_g1_i2:31-3006(+)
MERLEPPLLARKCLLFGVAFAVLLCCLFPVSAYENVDGQGYSWGRNDEGELGDDTRMDRAIPVAVHSQTGKLLGETIVQVSAGYYHSLVLTTSGTVFSWGYGLDGQLGIATKPDYEPVAQEVRGSFFGGRAVSSICAGDKFNIAMTTDGRVYAWGAGDLGQLGIGGTSSASFPIAIKGNSYFTQGDAAQIACAGDRSFVLKRDGSLVGWGSNAFGQVGSRSGISTLEPSPINTTGVSMTNGWSKIYCGTTHTIAITDNGAMYGWGSNFNGELAIDESTLSSIQYPIPLNFSGSDLEGKSIETFRLGYLFSVALTTDGKVACWGKGGSGQLGNRVTVAARYTPKFIFTNSVMKNRKVVLIGAGDSHAMAITYDGALFAWGEGSEGRLGNVDYINWNEPVEVHSGGALEDRFIYIIDGGYRHTLAANCGGNRTFVNGSCVCRDGYYGSTCTQECPGGSSSPCSNHGTCFDGMSGNGTCVCYSGYGMEACAAECPGGATNQCYNHGSCNDTISGDMTCTCFPGYYSLSCQYGCPTGPSGQVCNGSGTCDDGATGTGKCTCNAGYYGNTCEYECPSGHLNPCSGNGVCDEGTSGDGTCTCNANYAGFDCSIECTGCSGHGSCNDTSSGDGKCVCQAGYYGDQCESECPGGALNVCTGHGTCDDGRLGSGVCTCESGYFGSLCASECPGGYATPCNNHGSCSDGSSGSGLCTCLTSYFGPSCSGECPGGIANPCSGNGECFDGAKGNGTCDCKPGYFGSSCSSICPGGLGNICSNSGTCNDGSTGTGACTCFPGYYSLSCQYGCPTGPSGQVCNGSGTCDDGATGTGKCTCNAGYFGASCNFECPGSAKNVCSSFGTCDDGATGTGLCTCTKGYTGLDCSQVESPVDPPDDGSSDGGTSGSDDGSIEWYVWVAVGVGAVACITGIVILSIMVVKARSLRKVFPARIGLPNPLEKSGSKSLVHAGKHAPVPLEILPHAVVPASEMLSLPSTGADIEE